MIYSSVPVSALERKAATSLVRLWSIGPILIQLWSVGPILSGCGSVVPARSGCGSLVPSWSGCGPLVPALRDNWASSTLPLATPSVLPLSNGRVAFCRIDHCRERVRSKIGSLEEPRSGSATEKYVRQTRNNVRQRYTGDPD